MAIDTNNKKLSLITYHQPFNAPIPFPDGSLDQADNQHLIWGYAGILWRDVWQESKFANSKIKIVGVGNGIMKLLGIGNGKIKTEGTGKSIIGGEDG